jgi:hypothetical protein
LVPHLRICVCRRGRRCCKPLRVHTSVCISHVGDNQRLVRFCRLKAAGRPDVAAQIPVKPCRQPGGLILSRVSTRFDRPAIATRIVLPSTRHTLRASHGRHSLNAEVTNLSDLQPLSITRGNICDALIVVAWASTLMIPGAWIR